MNDSPLQRKNPVKRLEKLRDDHIKTKPKALEMPCGMSYEAGYLQALKDAAKFVRGRSWPAIADKVERLNESEEF